MRRRDLFFLCAGLSGLLVLGGFHLWAEANRELDRIGIDVTPDDLVAHLVDKGLAFLIVGAGGGLFVFFLGRILRDRRREREEDLHAERSRERPDSA
jgi:TRAP-type C4-dicarboxylate transport system permease small subunit